MNAFNPKTNVGVKRRSSPAQEAKRLFPAEAGAPSAPGAP